MRKNPQWIRDETDVLACYSFGHIIHRMYGKLTTRVHGRVECAQVIIKGGRKKISVHPFIFGAKYAV